MLKRIMGLTLLVVCLAFAKTYTFSVSTPAQLGNALLNPGEYSLKVDGEQVVLIDSHHQRIETNATIETSDKKFPQTSVLMTTAESVARIESVQLGGTDKKVVFPH